MNSTSKEGVKLAVKQILKQAVNNSMRFCSSWVGVVALVAEWAICMNGKM